MSDSKEVRTNSLAQRLFEILKSKTGLLQVNNDNKKVIQEILEVVSTFGDVLQERGALELLPKALSELSAMITSEMESDTVYVRTPVELDPTQIKNLTDKLTKTFGKKISVKQIIDNEVSGGLIIEYNDKVIDLSIDKQLEDLRNKLKS